MIYTFVWKSRAPPYVHFFGWLLLRDCIQCQANLYHKNILDDATCELCHQAPETSDHLIFHCTIARQFWDHLGWRDQPFPPITELWNMPRPANVSPLHFNTLLLLSCWNIWNPRHDVVFRPQASCLRWLLSSCKEACRLWGCRLRAQDRVLTDTWCNLFTM